MTLVKGEWPYPDHPVGDGDWIRVGVFYGETHPLMFFRDGTSRRWDEEMREADRQMLKTLTCGD